jgi:hypothetical protein
LGIAVTSASVITSIKTAEGTLLKMLLRSEMTQPHGANCKMCSFTVAVDDVTPQAATYDPVCFHAFLALPQKDGPFGEGFVGARIEDDSHGVKIPKKRHDKF